MYAFFDIIIERRQNGELQEIKELPRKFFYKICFPILRKLFLINKCCELKWLFRLESINFQENIDSIRKVFRQLGKTDKKYN